MCSSSRNSHHDRGELSASNQTSGPGPARLATEADRERWTRVKTLLQEALELPTSERGAFLDRVCADDIELRTEIDSLLGADEAAGDFLEDLSDWTDDLDLARLEADRIGSRIGPYRVDSCLGRGGMGSVYLGVRDDGVVDKRVAIKIVRRGMATREVLRRFHRERQIIADLDHPNIVRLLDGGTTSDGLPHFIMELVEGDRIDTYCDSRSLTDSNRAALMLRVCRAVDAAHRRGVVHRDLKPSNILITRKGEPKILDFGIAKVLRPDGSGETADPTQFGERPITPEFASPEQIRGDAVSPASDVYSLGVILYRLLAGRSPYRLDNHSSTEIERVICTSPVPRLTGLNRDLEAIVLKALRKSAADRYPTAGDLAADLANFLEAKPVEARKGNVRFYLKRAFDLRRLSDRPKLAFGAAAVTILLALTAIVQQQLSKSTGEATVALELQQKDWILVTDFTTGTVEATLASGVTESFKRLLGESFQMRVLSPQRLHDALRLLDQPLDVTIDASVAKRVAQRDPDVRAILTGKLDREGNRYRLQVGIIDPRSDLQVAGFGVDFDSTDQLPDATRQLAGRVRRALGEPEAIVRQSTQRLGRVTTPSYLALELYSEADRVLAVDGDNAAAEQLLRSAVAEDPDFASAQIYLAWTLVNQGKPAAEYLPYAERAMARVDQLTPRERHFIEGSYHQMIGRLEEALASYDALLRLYPDHFWAANNIQYCYLDLGRPSEATPYILLLADHRPNDFLSNQRAAWTLATLDGDIERAIPYATRAEQMVTHDLAQVHRIEAGWIAAFPANRAWIDGDIDTMLDILNRSKLELVTDPEDRIEQFPPGQEIGAVFLAHGYLALGRLETARQILLALPSSMKIEWLAEVAYNRNDLESFRRYVAREALLHSRSRHRLPSLLVRGGLVDDAVAVAAELEHDWEGYADLARGEIAWARGQPGEAVRWLESALDHLPLINSSYFFAVETLARARREMGDEHAATEVLEEASGTRLRAAALGNQAAWLRNHHQLASAYRRAGHLDAASEVEEELRRLLRLADPDHPIVRALERIGAPAGS